MLDIDFYQKFGKLKQQMLVDDLTLSKQELFDVLEEMRNPYPVVYNLETTNFCNMNCKMCPGPTKMTRKRIHMSMKTYLLTTEVYRQKNFYKKTNLLRIKPLKPH